MKYYVKFGGLKKMVNTGNPYAAAVKTFESYMINKERRKLPTFFSVSQKGFDEHEDDYIIGVEEIIQLLQLSNRAKVELEKNKIKES
jgi:hypothetical protein